MTDEEHFKQLFQKFGIELEQPQPTTVGTVYEIRANKTPKVDGYNGFMAEFYFDHDGGFLEISIVE